MNIFDQLRRDESCVLHAYPDSLGYLTIGIGHLIDARKGGSIPQAIADQLLTLDVQAKHDELDRMLPWWEKLDDARKGVILNLAFNLGVAGLVAFHNTLTLIEQGKFDEAAAHVLTLPWASQVGARAQRLAQQLKTGTWQ